MNVVREQQKLKQLLRIMLVLNLLTLVLQVVIILKTRGVNRNTDLAIPASISSTMVRPANDPLQDSLRRYSGDNREFVGKNLLDILKIRGPVGMFVVAASALPVYELVTGFGSIPRASSEGFLDSLTRREAEVICFDYTDLSEYVLFGDSHFSNGRQSIQGRRRRAPGENQAGVAAFAVTPRLPVSAKNGSTAERDERVSNFAYLRERLRHNLMMTASHRILVSLKPTDESLWERTKSYERGS